MSLNVVNPYRYVEPLTPYTYTYAPTGAIQDSDVGGSNIMVGEGANTTSSLFYDSYIQSVDFFAFNPASNAGTCYAVQCDETGYVVHNFWNKDTSTLGTVNNVMSSETSTPSTVKFEQYHSLGLWSNTAIKLGVNIYCSSGCFDGSDTCRIVYSDFDTGSAVREVESNYDIAFLVTLKK